MSRNARIKVLIALEGAVGGALRHIDYLLRFADPDEFDIHLAVSARRAPHVREDFERWKGAGWPVHEIPMQRAVSPDADARALGELLALCRRERYDIVHTHCAKAGVLGRAAGTTTGARTIHTPHVFPFSHDFAYPARALYLVLERAAARLTDRFVLLSNYQLNLFLSLGMALPDKAVVIPNGVMPDELRAADRRQARRLIGAHQNAKVVLFAGRLCEQKGVDVLLDAAERLRGGVDGLHVAIVGEGPLAGWLALQVKSRSLSDVVRFYGHAGEMAPYYAACDLVVMPSRAEGMPYVLLEARAAGRPVVATLVCGMEEFIEDGEDGFLVPPENPEALARTLERVLSDPQLLSRTKKMARRSLPPDGWNARQSAERVFDLYRELAQPAVSP